MAIIERWYDQDLTKSVPTRMLGNLYYQDSDSVKLGVRVFSNGQPVALDGSITGYAVLSNGFTVPINTGVKSGNAASITLPPSVFSELGIVRITLKNTSGNVATTILSGVGVVVQTRTNDTVLPGQVVTDWTNQITEAMQEVTDAAESLTTTVNNIIATPYDSLTFPVEVNTYTIRSGKLYRCKTRIETSEAWTSGHWVQVKVGNELSVLEPKAVSSDIGKVLKVKTVGNGKVTSYELGEAVVIDATLTNAGQAADAKAAGDRINWNNAALSGIVSQDTRWAGNIYYGYYDAETGEKKSGTKYVKIDKTNVYAGWTLRFLIGSNYVFRILFWKHSSGSYLPEKATPWHDEAEGYTFYVGQDEDVAIDIRRKDMAEIGTDEKNAIAGTVKIYSVGTDRGTLEELSYTKILDCHYAGIYRSGSSYVQSITDMPSDYSGGAFVLEVIRPAFASDYFAFQKLHAVDGSEWVRTIQQSNSGVWSVSRNWVKITAIGMEERIDENSDNIDTLLSDVSKISSANEWNNGAFRGIVSQDTRWAGNIYYGYYDVDTGEAKTGTKYVKIDKTYVYAGWTLRFLIGSNYVFRILFWEHSTGNYLPNKATPWRDDTEGYTFYVGKDEEVAIDIRRKDSAEIGTDEKNAIGETVKIFSIGTDRGTLEELSYTTTLECHYAGIYRSGSAYVQSITDMPSDYTSGGFVLEVIRPAFANNYFAYQKLYTVDGSKWVRTIYLQNNGNWVVYQDWIKTSAVGVEDAVNKNIEITNLISNHAAEAIPYSVIADGYVRADTGANGSSANYERTYLVDISGYEYIVYSRAVITSATTTGGAAFYTGEDLSTFISGSGDYLGTGAESDHYEERIIKVPEFAKYARFTLKKSITGFYVKGFRKSPLNGLKLSLLGASIETFAGAIPEGNDVYYTGSNYGIKNVNEMWWKVLCNNTGMIPLVIDAWSGSGVCYNYATDSAHSDTRKIPMCSDLRTGRLGTETDDPDIILMVGGTNDWTYSQSTTTPLGNWNGRTAVDRQAVVSGQSTFMESYASMIAKLHENYPNAILVGVSLEFCCRGTSLGITRVNDMGYTESDYSDAIERVCKIMGVPFIDVYNVGFNYDNYYPTYAQDSSTDTTHPNARGHAVIAKRMIEELPKVVKQFR